MRAILALLALFLVGDMAAQATPIALVSLPDQWGRPGIIVHYQGQPLRLLLDTGAAGTILRPSAWAALGKPGAGREAWVADWRGTEYLVPKPQLDGVTVGTCTLNDLDMLVADASLGPDAPGGYSGIAGVNLLRRLGDLTIDLNRSLVTTARCG